MKFFFLFFHLRIVNNLPSKRATHYFRSTALTHFAKNKKKVFPWLHNENKLMFENIWLESFNSRTTRTGKGSIIYYVKKYIGKWLEKEEFKKTKRKCNFSDTKTCLPGSKLFQVMENINDILTFLFCCRGAPQHTSKKNLWIFRSIFSCQRITKRRKVNMRNENKFSTSANFRGLFFVLFAKTECEKYLRENVGKQILLRLAFCLVNLIFLCKKA